MCSHASDLVPPECRAADRFRAYVTFEIRVGIDVIVGTVIQTIVVPIAQQGNGSQGSAYCGALTADLLYTVCEIPVPGYTPFPRPGNQGGSNQTLVPGAPCSTAKLGPGNNVLQFNNLIAAVLTATATATSTATATATFEPTATSTIGLLATTTVEPTETVTAESTATETTNATATGVTDPTPTTDIGCNTHTGRDTLAFAAKVVGCASPVVETPEIPAPTIPVTSLHSTGDGSNSSNGQAVFVVLGLTMLGIIMTALAFRRSDDTSA